MYSSIIQKAINRHWRRHERQVKKMVFNWVTTKRFLKGLGAYLLGLLLTGLLSYTATFLQHNSLLFGGTAGLIGSILLMIEKSIPNNL